MSIKTYKFKLLLSQKEKNKINEIIFIKNQIRNYLIELFSKDENNFLSKYIDKDFIFTPTKGKNKNIEQTTKLLISKINEEDNRKMIFINDKQKLRDILKDEIKNYLNNRKISIKKSIIPLSKPIQLIVEDFINNFNKIFNSPIKDYNYTLTGDFVEGSFDSDFGLNIIYPKKWNKKTLKNGKISRNRKGEIKLNKTSFKAKITQKVEGNIKYFTIKKDNLNQYFINIYTQINTNSIILNEKQSKSKSEKIIKKFNENFNKLRKIIQITKPKICSLDFNFENLTVFDYENKSSQQISLFNKELLENKYDQKRINLQNNINEFILKCAFDNFQCTLEYKKDKNGDLTNSISWKKLKKEEKKEFKSILYSNKKYVKSMKLLKKIDKHITNKQNDFYKKIVNKIINKYDLFLFEELSVKNMTKDKDSNFKKRLYNVRLYKFFNFFLNKIKITLGKNRIIVNSFYNSQKCFKCKYNHENNRQNQSTFLCVKCGFNLNRDYNRALNIFKKSLKFIDLYLQYNIDNIVFSNSSMRSIIYKFSNKDWFNTNKFLKN